MIRLFFIAVLMTGVGFGQDVAGALKAARELSGAVKTGDMTWMAEKMYPGAKRRILGGKPGGEKEMMEQIRAAQEEFKQSGVQIETYEVLPATGSFWVNTGVIVAGPNKGKRNPELLVVLPTRIVVKMKLATGDYRREQKSYLLAVAYKNEPNKWYFIQGSQYNLNDLKYIFHELPDQQFIQSLPPIVDKELK